MVGGGKWVIYEVMKKYARKKEIPAAFSSLSEARDSLVFHWHMVSYSINDIWDPTNEKLTTVLAAWKKKSMSILERWASAFEAFQSTRGKDMTETEKQGAAVLCILKELGSSSMLLTRTLVDDQTKWDGFYETFLKIVSLAEGVVERDLKSTHGRPTFCIDMAIVAPLFEVACRCRDPIIRRRAISVLQDCGRTEGVWNAFLTAKVAQRVVEIEEAGLMNVRRCEDVPDWARISSVSPLFDPISRKATLTYSRVLEHEGPLMASEQKQSGIPGQNGRCQADGQEIADGSPMEMLVDSSSGRQYALPRFRRQTIEEVIEW